METPIKGALKHSAFSHTRGNRIMMQRLAKALVLAALAFVAAAWPSVAGEKPAALLASELLEVRPASDGLGYSVVERSTGEALLEETCVKFEDDEKLKAGVGVPELPEVRMDGEGADYSLEDWSTGEAFLGTSNAKSGGAGIFAADFEGVAKIAKWRPVVGGKRVGEYGVGGGGATVTLQFTAPNVLRVDIRGSDETKSIQESFAGKGETFMGLHSDRGPVVSGTVPLLGWRNGRGAKYNSTKAPFYLTNHKYGIYVDSVRFGQFDLSAQESSFTFHDTSELTYYVIYGEDYAQIMQSFNAIAGPAFMPPDWAFSTIWWRDNPTQADLEKDLVDLRRLRIPAGAMWIDRPWTEGGWGWGGANFGGGFPDPDGMIAKMKEQNVKLMTWIANRLAEQLSSMSTNGLGAPTPGNGTISAAADMRKPEAVKAFQDYLAPFIRRGVHGYKIDRGDEGEVPDGLQSENVYLFAKAVAEGLEQQVGKDYFILQRCSYDKSRQYAAVWNGDTRGFPSGLAGSVGHGLTAGIINFPMWGSDTGGYQGNGPADVEGNSRWAAFSCYSPVFQVILEKYDIRRPADDAILAVLAKFGRRHHELLPYSRSCMFASTRTGMPIMRGMCFEFPDDPAMLKVWDQYFFGPSLLVAPVTASGATTRKVILPTGQWLDGNDGKTVHTGPATVEVPAPLDVMPLFIREGAILPVGDILQLNNNWTPDWQPHLRVEVYAGNAASRFDYYTGKTVVPMTCASENGTLTVAFDDPGVAGEVAVFCSEPKAVKMNGTSLAAKTGYNYDAGAHRLTVPFQGGVKLELAGADSLFVAEPPAEERPVIVEHE